jgi:hypothetical protein
MKQPERNGGQKIQAWRKTSSMRAQGKLRPHDKTQSANGGNPKAAAYKQRVTCIYSA